MPEFFDGRVTRSECLRALLLAAVCALAFLGAGVLPTRAVVPFGPEVFDPAAPLQPSQRPPEELRAGNASMGDKFNQSLAWDRITQDALRRGELPSWAPELGSGAPFVPQMGQVYQPWNLLLLLPIPSAGLYGPWFFLHLTLFGLGAFWFLRRLGAGPFGSALGLVAATLCLWTQARIHHNVILTAALSLFPTLTLIGGGFVAERFGKARIAGIGALLGLSWLAGFAPVAWQVSAIALLWALYCAARTKRARRLLPTMVAFGLGAALSSAQMIPVLLASMRSSRPEMNDEVLRLAGLDGASWRTLIWPDLYDWPAQNPVLPSWASLASWDWQKAQESNYPENAMALGLVPLLSILIALGAAIRRPKQSSATLLFAGIAILGLGLAHATEPFLGLSKLMPGARAGDLRRFLFTFSMAGVVLAGLGFETLCRVVLTRRLAIGAFGLVALASIWSGFHAFATDENGFLEHWKTELLESAQQQGIDADGESILAQMRARDFELPTNRDSLRACFGRTSILALLGGLAFALLRDRRRTIALIGLTAIELVVVGRGTIVPVAVERVTESPALVVPAIERTRAALEQGLPPPRFGRGLPPTSSRITYDFTVNLAAYHGLHDVFAYHPLPSSRVEEIYAALEPGTPIVIGGAGTRGIYRPETLSAPFFQLLGMDLLIVPSALSMTDLGWRDITPAAVAETGTSMRLWARNEPFPRASFVDRSEIVTEKQTRIDLVASRSWDDLRTIVTLEDPEAPRVDGDGVPEAEILAHEHSDDRVVIRIRNDEPGYLRLADPYDPGWTATVDGRTTEVYAADHRLRAVHLEPGEHEVVFAYDGTEVWGPRWLSLLTGIALATLAVLGAFEARRRNSTKGVVDAEGADDSTPGEPQIT